MKCPAARGETTEEEQDDTAGGEEEWEAEEKKPTYYSWQRNGHGKSTLSAALLHLCSPPCLHSLSDGWPLQYMWLILGRLGEGAC